jgi:hypothetical protein
MHKIELLVTHTHAQKVYVKGSVITVDEATALWLIERGVGHVAATTLNTPQPAPIPLPPTQTQPKPHRKSPKE